MTNEQLKELLARAICRGGICGPRAHLDKQEETNWRTFAPEAQAVIKALTPMIREVVQSILIVREWLRHYDLPFDEQPDWNVDNIRFDEAIASLPDCWREPNTKQSEEK